MRAPVDRGERIAESGPGCRSGLGTVKGPALIVVRVWLAGPRTARRLQKAMGRVIATALLVALAATPAFALWCEARCAAPEASPSAGRAAHSHHSYAATHDGFRAPGSGPQVSGLPRNCTTHLAADVAAPERAWSVCGPAEPSSVVLAEAPGGPASRLSRVMRPPLVALTAAPLRI